MNAPVSSKPIDLICPFRDEEKSICTIYDVRPMICKVFQCNLSPEEVAFEAMRYPRQDRVGVNVRATFFGEFDEGDIAAMKVMEMRAKLGGQKIIKKLCEGI